jgi:hypothetical protein
MTARSMLVYAGREGERKGAWEALALGPSGNQPALLRVRRSSR